MTAGLRRHDVHFNSANFFDNVKNVNDTISPTPDYNRPPRGNRQNPAHGSYFSRSFNSNVVVVMAVLLFALVVAAFVNTIARCVLRRRRAQPPEEHSGTEKGLDKSVIEALPVVSYGTESLKSFVDPAGENECVVCLSEFVGGEKIRLLPECQHGFHLVCIDTWLLTHTTCPVCRRGVLPAEVCSEEELEPDPSCARSVAGGSARIGSSRFGSARIASVDIEIEPSGHFASGSTADSAAVASASTSRPKRSFGSILSTEAMANIIHGVGSRRFALRNQNQNQNQGPV